MSVEMQLLPQSEKDEAGSGSPGKLAQMLKQKIGFLPQTFCPCVYYCAEVC